jgi:hypothetical protein
MASNIRAAKDVSPALPLFPMTTPLHKALYKECELRRLGDGRSAVERTRRWLPAEHASIGRVVRLDAGERWEIISAPEPALPAAIVRRFDPTSLPLEGVTP